MRYTRNRIVIGEEGQNKLLSSSIMIIGCGALGGQIAMLMAGSGIGTIGIADFDVINITNLHRQLFFSEGTIGESKAEVLSERMINLNSDVEVRVFKEKITEENAIKIFKDFDVIVDATDIPLIKYSIADITHILG
ncbi:MAG: ThiF family adenylyltransferase [Muribaculaceae bacterium]|nr:ThiF family adenylyltransferase [Muribaculaceae bacterium]